MRILLTGFGPFGNVKHNPSEQLLMAFSKSPTGVNCEQLTVQILPVSFATCGEWVDRFLAAGRFDIVLQLGAAAGASKFRLETMAKNHCSQVTKDIRGKKWKHGVIVPGGPQKLPASVPFGEICPRLRATGLPVKLSKDSGDYLCNFLFYKSLHTMHAINGISEPSVGFVHIPWIADATGSAPLKNALPLSVHLKVLRMILREVIRARQVYSKSSRVVALESGK